MKKGDWLALAFIALAFVPFVGFIFVECDSSQREARERNMIIEALPSRIDRFESLMEARLEMLQESVHDLLGRQCLKQNHQD